MTFLTLRDQAQLTVPSFGDDTLVLRSSYDHDRTLIVG